MLGSSEFLLELLKQAEENVKYQLPSEELKRSIKEEIQKFCHKENINISLLRSGNRCKPLPSMRKLLAVKLVNEHGGSLSETAIQISVSKSGIAQMLRRSMGKLFCILCKHLPQHQDYTFHKKGVIFLTYLFLK